MKVAISLPDPVFDAAERLAEQLKVSRSQLYAEALSAYLGSRGADAVTERAAPGNVSLAKASRVFPSRPW